HHEDQHRTCIDSDEFNRPLYLTRIAAAGHPGIQVEETAFTYDEAGAASSIVQDPSSTEPGGRLYLRDSFERIVAIGDQVAAGQTNWTCLQYEDPLLL